MSLRPVMQQVLAQAQYELGNYKQLTKEIQMENQNSDEEMQLERIILADNDLPTAKADCVISDLADQLTASNEKYANCVRQLTEAHARIDRFEAEPKGWWHKEVEELKQQLTAAQATIKVKDDYLNLLIGYTSESTVASLIVQKALAATEPKL